MALKLGAYTACLHDRPLAEALDILKANGLTSVEVNTGGFIPSPTARSTSCCPPRPPARSTWPPSPTAGWS